MIYLYLIIIYLIFFMFNYFMKYIFKYYKINNIWYNKKWLLNCDYNILSYKMRYVIIRIIRENDKIRSKVIYDKIIKEIFE